MHRRLRPAANTGKSLLPRVRVVKQAKPPPAARPGRLAAAGELSGAVRTIVLNVMLVVVTVLAMVALVREVRSPVTMIGKIHVPEDLVKAGLTPELAAQRLQARLRTISMGAKTVMKHSAPADQMAPTSFQIQVAGVEFQHLVRLLKQVFHINDTVVTGEIAHTGTGMEFRAFIAGPSEVRGEVHAEIEGKDTQQLFLMAGDKVQMGLSPYVLSSYLSNVEWDRCEKNPPCDFSQSIALFKSILSSSSRMKEHQWAYLGWSWVLARQDKFQEGAEMAGMAATVSGPFSEGYNSWGRDLLHLRSYDAAIEKFRIATKIDSSNTRAFFNWGDALSKQKKWAEADKKYALAVQAEADMRAEAYSYWGSSLLLRGKAEEAIIKFREALALEPGHYCVSDLAVALATTGQVKEANELFEHTNRIHSKDTWRLGRWVDGLVLQKRWDEAFANLKEIEGMSPGKGWVYTKWANALIKSMDFEGGFQMYRAAAARPLEGRGSLCANWGASAYNNEIFEEAATAFRCAANEEPTKASHWVDLGDSIGEDGDYQAAIEFYQRALQIDSKWSSAHKGLGIAALKRKDWDSALSSLRATVEFDPTDWYGHFELGDLLWEKGRTGEARTAYAEAVRNGAPLQKRRFACSRLAFLDGWILTQQCAN